MTELIDIFDANLHHLGVATREEVHREAHWHRTFHCWLVSSAGGGSILFQMRSAGTENYPGLYDVSAAGHLLAGESVEEGLREAGEELGVAIPAADLHFLGYRVEVVDKPTGYRDREFQAVHMVRLEQPLSSYDPQVAEVAGLAWVGLLDAKRLFSGAADTVKGTGVRYDGSSGRWLPFAPELRVGCFVPRLERYYLSACITAERLLEGRFPLAV